MLVLFAQQNTVKTANQNSIINFYFVTVFYYFDNICMVDMLLFRYAKLIRMVPKIGTAYQLQYLASDIIVISAMLAISYNTILVYNNG